MPEYKLTYYDIRGLAEPIRMLFAMARVQFEDHRFKFEEREEIIRATPLGQVPVLYIDGKPLGQSMTICRFLAKEFHLVGENTWEDTKMDELVDFQTDLTLEWAKWHYQRDAGKKAEAKICMDAAIPKFLAKLNEIQGKNGGDFLVGRKVSWADIVFANRLEEMESTVSNALLNDYPNLRKLKNAVFSIPNINAFVNSRPPEFEWWKLL